MSESISAAAESAALDVGAVLRRHADDFEQVLPPTMDLRRWLRLAESAMNANPDLVAAFQRDRGASMLRGLMKCAAWGHEPGSGLVHLVPQRGGIECWEDYKGVIQRILRSGLYTKVVAAAVYTNDLYEFNANRDDRPRHEPAEGNRGTPVRSYAYAVHFGGAASGVGRGTPEAIAKAKAKARNAESPNSPWQTSPEEMYVKVAVKALEKLASTSSVDLRVIGGAVNESDEAA